MACSHLWLETGNTRISNSNGKVEYEFECSKCNATKWESEDEFS